MSKDPTLNNSQTNWQHLDAMTDEDIDFSDCPEVTSEMFSRGIVRHGLTSPGNQTQVTLRLDNDVVEWFQSQGQGYQFQINQLLRAYMEAHQQG